MAGEASWAAGIVLGEDDTLEVLVMIELIFCVGDLFSWLVFSEIFFFNEDSLVFACCDVSVLINLVFSLIELADVDLLWVPVLEVDFLEGLDVVVEEGLMVSEVGEEPG